MSCSRKILYPSEPGSGTYLFFLPRSTARSREVAFGNLESGKLRFGPYDTLAHTYRTISPVSRPRRFLFASHPRVYIRARNARLRLVRSLCFLLPHRKENRSLV